MVYRRPTDNSKGYFYIKYRVDRSKNAKEVYFNTFLKDYEKALAMHEEMIRLEKMARDHTFTVRQIRRRVEDICARVCEANVTETVSIEQSILRWLTYQQEKPVPASTFKRYSTSINRFREWLGDRKTQWVWRLTNKDFREYFDYLTEQGFTPHTLHAERNHLDIWLGYCRHADWITDELRPKKLRLPKLPTHAETFTQEEMDRIVMVAPGEWKTLVLFGYYLGTRIGDATQMRWSHINPSITTITFTMQKTRRTVTVPLHKRLAGHLRALAEDYMGMHEGRSPWSADPDYISPRLAKIYNTDRHQTIPMEFQELLKLASVDTEIIEYGRGGRRHNKTFHTLRHSLISNLLNMHVPKEVRMQLAGHQSAESHKKYSHMDASALQIAVGQLPVIGEEQPKCLPPPASVPVEVQPVLTAAAG